MPKVTVQQVHELVSHVWTDATHLPETPSQIELCDHLANAMAVLDLMLEEEKLR